MNGPELNNDKLARILKYWTGEDFNVPEYKIENYGHLHLDWRTCWAGCILVTIECENNIEFKIWFSEYSKDDWAIVNFEKVIKNSVIPKVYRYDYALKEIRIQ